MIRKIWAGAGLVAMAALSTATPTLAQQAGDAEATPCPVTLPWEGETEGETFNCGVVLVPENHEQPDGKLIEIAYLRLKASTLSPAPDPLIYLSGGPGGSALHEVTSNKVLFQNMLGTRERRDVVFFDQRGTGHSHLLACGPFNAAIGVVGELFGDRPNIDIDQLEKLNEGDAGQALLISICAGGYESVGVDLGQFNSVASAHDIAMLAASLGYDQGYNLYGTSYGTRLALNALRSTPEHIRAVVLDGTVSPANSGTAMTTAKIQEHYNSIFEQCAADAFCGETFPDLRERFIALLTKLQDEPLVIDPPIVPNDAVRSRMGVIDQVSPDFFARFGLLNNGAAQGGYAAMLPPLIGFIEAGDVDALRGIFTAPPKPEAAIVETPTTEDVLTADDSFIAPSINILLAQALGEAEPAETTVSQDWVRIALADLYGRLNAGEAQAEVIRDMVDLAVVPLSGTDAAALTSFADEHLSPEAGKKANALVAAMDRQQVRETMWAIQDVGEVMMGASERSGGLGVSFGAMFAVNCSEDISLTPEEFVDDYTAASPYPGVTVQSVETYRLLEVGCRFFPKPFTREEMMSPVSSDKPVLIFQEALDTQTPLSMGRQVLETLSNGYLVEWKSEGHVIAGRSIDGCAGDIAAAFFDNPAIEPDSTCSTAPYYTLPFKQLYDMAMQKAGKTESSN